jgi:hypothetical protein
MQILILLYLDYKFSFNNILSYTCARSFRDSRSISMEYQDFLNLNMAKKLSLSVTKLRGNECLGCQLGTYEFHCPSCGFEFQLSHKLAAKAIRERTKRIRSFLDQLQIDARLNYTGYEPLPPLPCPIHPNDTPRGSCRCKYHY